jgi:hypothetical protein
LSSVGSYAGAVPNWEDLDDPAWASLASHGMAGESLMKIGDLTFGRGDHLPHRERIERGITALAEKGFVWERPSPDAASDDEPVVVYRFVRPAPRDPVTRWGARLVLLTVVVCGLAFAVFLVSELYSGLE